MEVVKQKWVKETGVFYPISGDTTLHLVPGSGVFQVYEEKSIGCFLMFSKSLDICLFLQAGKNDNVKINKTIFFIVYFSRFSTNT